MGPIAKSTIKTTLVLGVRLMVQAGTLLCVARMLGPEQFGAFAGIAALAVLLGALASFGSNLVLLSSMSRDVSLRGEVLRWAIPIILIVGAFLLIVFTIISKILFSAANLSWVILFSIGISEIWLQPLFSLIATEYHANDRIAYSQLLHISPLLLRMLLAVSILILSPESSFELYAVGYFIASFLILIISIAVSNYSWPTINTWRLPRINEIKATAGFAIINISNLGPSELDKTLAARLLPMAEAGIYSASARVIGAVVLPVVALLLSALPRLFREGVVSSKGEHLTRWIFIVTVLYGFFMAGLIWIVAPIFKFIFGSEYNDVSTIIQLLCLVIPGLSLRLAAGNVLMAHGKPWIRAGFELLGIIALLVSSITLTSRFGIIGMPLAWATSELLMAAIGWYYIYTIMDRY
jgi:O-antigen/teichoic acid export membrane protein